MPRARRGHTGGLGKGIGGYSKFRTCGFLAKVYILEAVEELGSSVKHHPLSSGDTHYSAQDSICTSWEYVE